MATTTVKMRQSLTTKDIVAVIWSIVIFAASIGMFVYGLLILLGTFSAASISAVAPQLVTGIILIVAGLIIFPRYLRLLNAIFRKNDFKLARETMVVDFFQLILLVVLASILFPVLWIVSMSLDPRDFSRPQGLTIVPPGATLASYIKVLTQPSPNPVTFLQLLRNSLLVSGGTALLSVIIGTSAAYAFSRLIFPGRRLGMLGFVLVLMIPPGGTLAPLFVLLNALRIRTTLFGLAIAFTSTALPFAIWNMKGFIDSLPYDLEEAAQIDGATRTQGFLRVILPLAMPGIAVTALWGFLTGWSEFILSWTFLVDPSTFTLPMVMRGMVGQYASGTPWAQFSAMAILISIPPVLIFFFLQRYLVGGLAVGGVKG
jgi:arabinogalactan oligomer / maltooligosaccharide transport system permease protein